MDYRKPPPLEYRFKPGQSGNPKGKEKGSISITARMRKYLSMEIFDPRIKGEKRKVLAADLLVERLLEECLRNPSKMVFFLKEFMDRDEGRTDGKNVIEQTETPEDFAAKIREAKRQMEESVPSAAILEEAEDAEVEPVEE